MDTQQQFFSVNHKFSVSVDSLDTQNIPDDISFEQMMPPSFRLAYQMNLLEASALRPLKGLGEQAGDLNDFINLQAKKIDLMMGYILTLDEGDKKRLTGTSFGGSHLTCLSQDAIAMDELVSVKIFIDEGNCAIFAVARVIDCQSVPASNENESGYSLNLMYVKINEEAQEQLVRTSLHVQTLQLKEKSEARRLNEENQS